MARKSETTATFAVTLKIPTNSNAQEAQQFIRHALETAVPKANMKTCYACLNPQEFTVSLQKKVTTYGH